MSRSLRPCPICGKPPDSAHRPFCSGRCADIDLSRWLGGQYAIPAEDPPDELLTDEDEPPTRMH